MADKIVLINAQKPITGNYTYLPKPATADIPQVVSAADSNYTAITNIQTVLPISAGADVLPIVVANLPNSDSTVAASTSINVKVIVTNMGEEVVPNPNLFKRAQEYYTAIDSLTVTYKSLKFDQIAVSDQFQTLVQYRRVFQESKTTNDSYRIVTMRKGIRDTVSNTELVAKRVQKLFNDTFSRTDVKQIRYGKNLLNSVGTTTELVKLAYKKAADDSVNSTDLLTRVVSYKRTFTEYIDATDDFYGSANVDDDQIAQVGKTLVSWLASTDIKSIRLASVKLDFASVLDQKSVRLTKPFSDTETATDQVRFNPGKALASPVLGTDTSIVNTGKKLLDTMPVSDVKLVRAAKVLLDTTIFGDQFRYLGKKVLGDSYVTSDVILRTWSAQRLFSENSSTAERLIFNTAKVSLDTVAPVELTKFSTFKTLSTTYSVGDLFTRAVNYNRVVTDFVDATDDFFGSANIDDDQTARIGKTTIDLLSNTELLRFDLAKQLKTSFIGTDTVSNSAQKILLDGFTRSDIVNKSINKGTASNLQNSEQTVFAVQPVKLDTTLTSDPKLVKATKSLQDSFSSADAAVKTPKKAFAELTASSDTVSFYKFANRFFNEVIAAQSSGIINNQSYFAENYIQPGYAGTNTIIS
jgi:hypothetical protein